jgi:hypothetical protein
MKSWFFAAVFLALPLAILSALLYSFGRYLWTVLTDRRLYRELDAIEATSQSRRAERRRLSAERLNNGCEHVFDSGLSLGFPPDVCPKCGLERELPRGPCDHVWQRAEDPVPSSFCAKCGKRYRPTAAV